MRTLSSRPFCPCSGRRVRLGDLSAGLRYTTHAGDHVELRGFGSFRLRHRQARAGRNPRTGDTVQIAAKAVPTFAAGKAFQETVQTSAAPSDGPNGVATRSANGVTL